MIKVDNHEVDEIKGDELNINDSQITIKAIINSEEIQNEIFDMLINILKKQREKDNENNSKNNN